ncbi:MAG TPA: PKD domain-containing protein, partial [Chitinophagales bacterium]|nr:PKD domain-containing protein [Chitinophagales bacterium]
VSPPYTIAGWNWDFGDSQVSSLQHPAHIYAAPGAYTVTLTATTSSGCSSTQASSVTVHELPVLTLTPAPATCFGQSNGAITLAVANGLPGYTFIWSNGNTTQHLTGIPAGNYSVTVTDANSCTAAGNATVSQPSAGITITAVDSMSASCFAYNDGYITITATGGNGTLNYNWSNGVYSANNPNLIAGTYEVTVTDANGCSATASYAITEPQQLLLDVTPSDTTVKFGVPLQLTAALSPPDPSATIAWTPERDLSCYDCYAPQMTGTGTVVYTVNATNSAGCPASATATVTVLLDKILYIPNAFSPNGDTHNDDFRVYTFGDKRFKMAIFDRWGGEVFFTEDINQGWNGTIGGKEPVPGVYVYDVFIEYLDRRVERRQGSVVLLR